MLTAPVEITVSVTGVTRVVRSVLEPFLILTCWDVGEGGVQKSCVFIDDKAVRACPPPNPPAPAPGLARPLHFYSGLLRFFLLFFAVSRGSRVPVGVASRVCDADPRCDRHMPLMHMRKVSFFNCTFI